MCTHTLAANLSPESGGKPSWETYLLVAHMKTVRGCRGYKELFSVVSVHHLPPDKMAEVKRMYDNWRKCGAVFEIEESRDPG